MSLLNNTGRWRLNIMLYYRYLYIIHFSGLQFSLVLLESAASQHQWLATLRTPPPVLGLAGERLHHAALGRPGARITPWCVGLALAGEGGYGSGVNNINL